MYVAHTYTKRVHFKAHIPLPSRKHISDTILTYLYNIRLSTSAALSIPSLGVPRSCSWARNLDPKATPWYKRDPKKETVHQSQFLSKGAANTEKKYSGRKPVCLPRVNVALPNAIIECKIGGQYLISFASSSFRAITPGYGYPYKRP